MRPRNTLLLLLAALLLGGLVYWMEGPRATQRKTADAAAKRLFPSVSPADVEWIALHTTDGRDVEIERRGGAWSLVQPLEADGDPVSLDGMANALAEMTSEQTIADAQAPEIYGLGDGARVVRFRAKGTEHVLRVGKHAPIGANSYAMTGAAATIHTVPTYRTSGFDRALADLRERRVLRFDRNAVERIRLDWPGGGVALERHDGVWQMTEPLATPADDTAVDKLLSDIGFLRAESFLDAPTDDAALGLDAPEVRLGLRMKQADGAAAASPLVMEMARPLPNEAKQRAVRVAGRIYGVPVERLVDYPRTVVAWRLKDVSRFVATDAQRVELTLHDPASSAPVIASVSRRDEGWVLEGGQRLVSGKPTRLIAELSRLRAADILAETLTDAGRASFGLAPPAATIRVFGTKTAQDEPLLAGIEIGKSDEKGFVATPLGGGAVYRVEASLAEHIPTRLEAWKDKWLAKEAPPSGSAQDDGTDGSNAPPAAESEDDAAAGDEDAFPPGAAEEGQPLP